VTERQISVANDAVYVSLKYTELTLASTGPRPGKVVKKAVGGVRVYETSAGLYGQEGLRPALLKHYW